MMYMSMLIIQELNIITKFTNLLNINYQNTEKKLVLTMATWNNFRNIKIHLTLVNFNLNQL